MSTKSSASSDVPSPDDKDVEAHDQRAGGESQSRKPLIILAAMLAVLALIGGVFALTRGGDDEGNAAGGSSTAAEAGVTSSTPPEEIPDGYVDDSGQQEHEIEPVPGEYEGISAMALQTNMGAAPVDLVGLSPEGALIPPEDVSRLGWYASSTKPGEGAVGSTVITGHVNHQTQGQGYAYYFTQLKEGDTVSVLIDGEQHDYKVTKPPFRVAKNSGMPAEVNDTTGPNKLVLITCGGEFVGGSLGYADNVFVVAEPV